MVYGDNYPKPGWLDIGVTHATGSFIAYVTAESVVQDYI